MAIMIIMIIILPAVSQVLRDHKYIVSFMVGSVFKSFSKQCGKVDAVSLKLQY